MNGHFAFLIVTLHLDRCFCSHAFEKLEKRCKKGSVNMAATDAGRLLSGLWFSCGSVNQQGNICICLSRVDLYTHLSY